MKTKIPVDELPPHDSGMEAAALGCVLQAGNDGSLAQVDALLLQLSVNLFYDNRNRAIHGEFRLMREAGHGIDMITFARWLNEQKRLADCGGMTYIATLPDATPTWLNFETYLKGLQGLALRRWCLVKTVSLKALAAGEALSEDRLKAEFADLYEKSQRIGSTTAPMIHTISPATAREFEPDPADFMVGKGLITRGMIFTIGGEPGVGKSRLALTLAVAGARGNSRWQGYPVKSQWRTMYLQTENGSNRLKEDCSAIPSQFDDHIKITDSLSHGMAFDLPEFRRELRRLYDAWPFELLIVDPWNDIAMEDGQRDYKESLLNIQACFRGTKMPAVCIVAHLRKRGRDDSGRRKSGRELLHELSGSLALGSTSRTVFVVQSVSQRMDEDRIIFEIAKANDCHPDHISENGARSAWRRANGAFERIDEFDWAEYDNPGEPDRRKLTIDQVRDIWNGETWQKPAQIAEAVKKALGIGTSTTFRAIGEKGYLRENFLRDGLGRLRLKDLE